MKTIRLFSVGFLVVSVLFPQKSHSQDYTRMSLPEGAKARLGKGSVVLGVSGAEPISQIAYSRDGTRLAVASSIGVWLYDARTGAEVALLTRYSDRFFSVAFSPDGGTLASGGQEGTLLLWDLATGQLKDSLEGHTENVTFLAFSSNGNTLISGGQDYIRIGNNSVVTWLRPDTILLWDLASGKLKETLEGPGDGSASATYSPEGKSLASWSGLGIRLWNADSGQLKATIGGGFLAFSPDGSALATADREGIQWWDAENGQHIKTLAQHTNGFRSPAFSPDWTAVATGSWDGTIRFWDAFTGRLKATLEAHKDQAIFLAFSPDGGTLASGSYDKTIRLWNADSGQLKASLEGHRNGVKSLVISPDGRTLIDIGNSPINLQFWDVYSHQLKATIESYWAVYFPEAASLATSSVDGEIRLWDADSGQLKAAFTGHTDPVNSLAFAPNGRTLASGSFYRGIRFAIRLWNADSGD